MDEIDFYTTLGVNRHASMQEIKHAYRRLVRRYHPDLNAHNAAAESAIREINAAAEILCDPAKRAQYDRSLGSIRGGIPRDDSAECSDSVGVCIGYGRRDGHDVDYFATITDVEARIGTQRSFQFHAFDGRPYQLTVTIPAGVTTGARIRMPGAGGPGLNGGCRGDLYVVIRVTSGLSGDPVFQPPARSPDTPLSPFIVRVRRLLKVLGLPIE